MQKSSGFIGTDIQPESEFAEVKLLHSSEEGYAQLYTVRRHGKLYVLKGLKQPYKDQPLYGQLLRKEYEIGWITPISVKYWDGKKRRTMALAY